MLMTLIASYFLSSKCFSQQAIPLPVCISPIAKSSPATLEPTEDEEGSLLIKNDFQCRANAVQVDLEVLQKLLGPTGLDLPFDMVTRVSRVMKLSSSSCDS